MEKRELLEILQDWNFWKKELDTGKERKAYLEKCLSFLKTNVVTAIIGVRRAGKSYIMRQTIKELIEKGTERKDTLMINFEDKKQLLLTYFDDVLTKDIERRYKLKKGEKLRALARFYLTNISNPVTFNSLKTLLDTI